ncbi:E3 ubiquitin-protein ligase [Senna tora]|uniref:RING-type E3 ubiquitin transferase n=1 Tax=Senna tora TaxID=362788 RepID=A0A835CIM3_9FABA|nr:E3 ubiquitin-protein ligase [Senna tora]
MHSTSSPSPSSSSPPNTAMDSSPLLSHSISDHLLRSRRFIHGTQPPLRTAARFFRRASGRRMMLREPSVRVRESAAEQLEERQSDWAYSKPVIILDIMWNLALVAIGVTILGLSTEEKPCVPLRIWIVGYLLQGLFHSLCVVVEYRRRNLAGSTMMEEPNDNGGWVSVGDSNYSSGSDGEDSATEHLLRDDGNSFMKHIESANTMVSFLWWILGFYWITAGGQSLTHDSPQLYWLCITFLAFDIVIVLICVVVACLLGIAVCCCLPCILAIMYAVADQEGATTEEIDQLPKYKFRRIEGLKKVDGDIQEPSRGIMTECESDTPAENVLSLEDAECCICLTAYDDGAELRELPCNHHFHCTCIDKWLHINANCPLCKFNILRMENQRQEV